MITIVKQPYECSLTKNSMDFVVSTDLHFETATVYPFLVLSIKELPVLGTTYKITFTNPENGNFEYIDFVAVDGTNAINYKDNWQIPDSNYSGTLAQFRTILYNKMKERTLINAFYSIDLPIIEFPGSVPTFTIKAKKAISELVLGFESNQPTIEADKYISEANSITYYQPGVRDGYNLEASLFLERNYNSGVFEFVTSINCVLDENSFAKVDVSKYIDAEIEASWDKYPMPDVNTKYYIAPNLRKYYVVFSETFNDATLPFTAKTPILYAHWGGAGIDDAFAVDPITAINSNGNWLSWWPGTKRVQLDQNDWVGWMNTGEETWVYATLFVDFTYDQVYFNPSEEFIFLRKYETLIINSSLKKTQLEFVYENYGYTHNDIAYYSVSIQNWEKKYLGATVLLPDGISTNGRFYIFNNTYFNGYKVYTWLSSETIKFNGVRWEIYNSSDTLLAYLNTYSNEPIGNWLVVNTSSFLTLSTEVAGFNPYVFNKKFTIDKSCLTKEIAFFNSFGVPESFQLSPEFQQNVTTSQELATRTESFELNSLLPQNYIFDSKNIISYQAETHVLTNLEAERLMPLVNSTITFLREKNTYIPVILNAGTSPIYKVNSFLQKIKLDFVRANESDRVSYYEILPEITIALFAGVYRFFLETNGLNITDFGSIKAYLHEMEIGEFIYNDAGAYVIDGDALTSEGVIKYILTIEVDGVSKSITKIINYSWEMVEMQFIASSGALACQFDMKSFIPDAPVRIDWGDGTIENLTIATTTTVFDHTYSTEGHKFIRMFKPMYYDITHLQLYNDFKLYDFSVFSTLRYLNVYNAASGKYYLTGNLRLRFVIFEGGNLSGLDFGYQKSIEAVIIQNNGISSNEVDKLLREIWLFRKSYDNEFTVAFVSLGYSPSSLALAIANGTGAYSGDGLADNGITVIFS